MGDPSSKDENPFDALARDAVQEHRAGRTRKLIPASDVLDRELLDPEFRRVWEHRNDPLTVTFDPEADALYLRLRDLPVVRTVWVTLDITADYAEDGVLVGLESTSGSALLEAMRNAGILP